MNYGVRATACIDPNTRNPLLSFLDAVTTGNAGISVVDHLGSALEVQPYPEQPAKGLLMDVGIGGLVASSPHQAKDAFLRVIARSANQLPIRESWNEGRHPDAIFRGAA